MRSRGAVLLPPALGESGTKRSPARLARCLLAHQLAHEARRRNVSAASRTTVARPMKGTLNQKKAIKLLKEKGWTQARGGKHQVKMSKPGCRPITLPQHKGRDYPTGLAQAILKQAELR
jgi:predicted RNA binding protein YcfA (HicA-like mRNA interferase family)